MKNNSARKKLIPAAAMLAVSMAMLATSTYAWFTMNTEVSVTGMKMKATASDGLLISDSYDNPSWASSKDISMTAGVALSPTNTADGTEWVAAKSSDYDDADAEQTADDAYTTVSNSTSGFTYTAPDNNGATWITGEGVGSKDSTNYVLLKNFWIKSSGDEAWDKDLTVESVTAEIGTENLTGEANAAKKAKQDNLYKSFRVLVVVGDESYIYAPIDDYDTSIKFKGTGNNLTLVASDDQSVFDVDTIPNTDAGAINVKMYMYFEGEDENCKSSNIDGIDLNDIEVSATFGTVDNT